MKEKCHSKSSSAKPSVIVNDVITAHKELRHEFKVIWLQNEILYIKKQPNNEPAMFTGYCLSFSKA